MSFWFPPRVIFCWYIGRGNWYNKNMAYTLTVFGDSITFGKGDTLEQGWCGRLKKYFENKGGNHRLYNLGISGETTKDVLERFDVEAKARVAIAVCLSNNPEGIDVKPVQPRNVPENALVI